KTLQVDPEQFAQNGKFISQSDGHGPSEHAQHWQLQRVPDEDGWWVVRNRASNKVLEVDALHPHLNGSYVQQWDYLAANAFNQHWGLGRVEFRSYKLVNRLNGKVLEVDAEHMGENGHRVQQWEDFGPNQQNQLWSLVRVESLG